jgi:hypothetical protein
MATGHLGRMKRPGIGLAVRRSVNWRVTGHWPAWSPAGLSFSGRQRRSLLGSGAEDALKKVYLDLTLELMGVKDTELIALYAVRAVGEKGRIRYLEQVYRLAYEF